MSRFFKCIISLSLVLFIAVSFVACEMDNSVLFGLPQKDEKQMEENNQTNNASSTIEGNSGNGTLSDGQLNTQNDAKVESFTEPEKVKVYNTETKKVEEMEFSLYLYRVLAGEIHNNWPTEALKAQAILARTYTINFLKNKKSKYEGADISTDISEAQAYNEQNVNDAIKKAVDDTKNKVVTYKGELIEAWFFSNSGGKTTTATVGLSRSENPEYIVSVSSPENEDNSDNFSWTATISKTKILSALREMGISVSNINSFEIANKDGTGRAINFLIGGAQVRAADFRIKVGSTELKSTKIENIIVSRNSVYFAGKGYGHGVGLSQWGAKVMADQGKSAEDIIKHYYSGVEITG